MGRARPLGLGDRERLAHDLGHDLGARDTSVPLDDRAQDLDQVDVLVGLLVHPLEVRLAGQSDQRRAVQEGVGDRSDQVCGARPQRAEADARASRQPAVGVGHVGAALLVSHGNELDRGVGERLAQIERLLTRDAEHVAHALGLEALDEHV